MPTYNARLVTSATVDDETITFKSQMRMTPRNQMNLVATFEERCGCRGPLNGERLEVH